MRALSLIAASVWIGLSSTLVACGSSNETPPPMEQGTGGSSKGGSSAQAGAKTGGAANPGGNTTTSGGTSTGTGTTGGSTSTAGSGQVTTGGTGQANTGGSGNAGRPTGGTANAGTTQTTGGTTVAGTGNLGGTTTTGGDGPAAGTGAGQSGGASSGGSGGAAAPSGGTTGTGGGSGTTGGTTGTGGAAQPPFTLPVAVNAWKPSQACIDTVASKLASMTAADKAAQMIQGENISTTPAQVTQYHLGAIFSGGEGDPSGGNSASAWASMVTQYNNAANFGIPLLYGIDAVHGHNNVQDATMFPHNIGLGCTRDPDLVKRVFRAAAVEVRATGINWTFAPTIAAARDERWGRTFESFSEDPNLVAWIGQAAVEGLQGTSIANNDSILGCAKHFAGDGNTEGGTDQGNVNLSEADFKRLAVDQYQPLINSGVATVMISYNQYNGQRVTGNAALVTTMLKQDMGFEGIVVSDYNAVIQLPGGGTGTYPPPTGTQVAAGVNAGLDMLMMAGTTGTAQKPNWQTALELIQSEATAGRIAQSRIDDAARRILTVKCEMGMFAGTYSTATNPSQVGAAANRTVAREAVRKSLVVLKNDDNVLPLAKDAKVLVAGSAADSMAKQCGGWTVAWQGLGTSTTAPTTTAGTTILAGIRDLIGTANVTTGTTSTSGMTAGIVVVGESPYAESYGDATDVTLQARSSADHTTLNTMLGTGLPVVLVVISGRPLILDAYLGNANLKAVVAAWLPGSEGHGIADVLFGDYAPVGKLGHSWPKAGQIPINWDDSDYTSSPPAFPIGHGLSW